MVHARRNCSGLAWLPRQVHGYHMRISDSLCDTLLRETVALLVAMLSSVSLDTTVV